MSHRIWLVRVILLVSCCLTMVSAVGAQTNSATVTGLITDSSGALLPGAKVTATSLTTGLGISSPTDQSGRYTIQNLDPGTYDIKVELSGFATPVRRNQVILVGQTLPLDFVMPVASVAQTVEVQAAAPILSTTESVVSRVVEPEEVDTLPTISRNFIELATLSPGVIESSAGATPDIGTAPTYQTGIIVDGGSAENSFFGGSFINFAQDWIQEFSLVSEQAPAEYGRAAGGFLNAVTRSGGNNFHGRAYGFYQNADLNATPRFVGTAKPPFDQDRFGGMIGGPIKKDKLFFFAGYEFYHQVNPVGVVVPAAFVTPASPSGVFDTTSGRQVAMLKIDYQLNASNRISARGTGEYDSSVNSGLSTTRTLGNASTGFTKSYLPTGSWLKTISPTEVNQLQFTYGRQTPYSACNYAKIIGPYPGYPAQSGSLPGGDPVGWWAQLTYSQANLTTGCTTNYSYAGDPWVGYRDMVLSDTLSLTRGSHDIKVGVALGAENLKWLYIRNSADGAFSINGLNPFNPATPSTFPTSDTMNGFGGGNYQQFDLWGPNISLFAQDSFKVTRNLTLNYGLRYQFDFINQLFTHYYVDPHVATDTVAPLNPLTNDFSNISPRFGFAWTPFHDDGRTVLRGGFGVFYDEAHSEMDAIEYGQAIDSVDPVVVNATRPSQNPWCYGNTCTNASGVVLPVYQQYVEEVLAYSLATYTLPNFALGTYAMPGGATYTIPAPTVTVGGVVKPAPTSSGVIVDNQNFRTPGEVQITAGVGHEFSNSLNIQADYVYLRGFREVIFTNINVNTQGTLLNPQYGSIISPNNAGFLTDKSMRVKVSYRDHRGDTADLAYTLGWAYDDSAAAFSTASTAATTSNPFNPLVDYGPSGLDARNNLVLSSVLKGPWGFALSPIFTYRGGLPYTATTTLSVPGCPVYYSVCYPTSFSKNSLRGNPAIVLNMRLAKSFRLGEQRSATVFLEAYNLPNLTNYSSFQGSCTCSSASTIGNAKFMQPTAALNMRQLQVGGRFDF